jgi:prevent-host-death family protein
MTTTLNLYEAKNQLSALVDRAAKGEEIVIAKHGKPLAKLVAVAKSKRKRKPSNAMKIEWIADDFNAPLPPEILKSFGVES